MASPSGWNALHSATDAPLMMRGTVGSPFSVDQNELGLSKQRPHSPSRGNQLGTSSVS